MIETNKHKTGRFGRYWPYLVGGPVFGAVGSGMMYTVTELTSTAAIIGYQILVGVSNFQ